MSRTLRLLIVLGVMFAGFVFVLYAAVPSMASPWQQSAGTDPYADIYVYKYMVSSTPAAPGNELEYQLAYYISSTQSNAPAYNVVLTDTLPAGVEFVSWNGEGYVDGTYYSWGQLPGVLSPTIVGNEISWNLLTLNPSDQMWSGYSGYINVKVRVLDTASPGTTLLNQATITTTSNDPNPGNNYDSESTVILSKRVDLRIQKSIAGLPGSSGIGGPGTEMEYLLEIYNSSSTVSAENVVLTDTLPAGVTFVSWYGAAYKGSNSTPYLVLHEVVSPTIVGQDIIWNLPDIIYWDSSVLIFVRVQISESFAVGDIITNQVEITSLIQDYEPSDNVDTLATTLVAPYTNLALQKWSYTAIAGEEILYRLDYQNTGNLPIHNIVLTDTLPAEVTFISSYGNGRYNRAWSDSETMTPTQSGDDLVWTLPDLQPNDVAYLYIKGLVSDLMAPGDTFTNQAVISCDGEEANLTDNMSTRESTVVQGVVDLGLTKSLDSYPPTPGSEMIYDLYIRSATWSQVNVSARNVVVTDTLPVEAEFVSSDGYICLNGKCSGLGGASTPTVNGHQIIWNLQDIEKGSQGHLRVRVKITDTMTIGNVITNTAEISNKYFDMGVYLNSSTITTTIGQPIIDLDVSKNLRNTAGGPGGQMDFSIYIANDGNTTAHNVVLTDTLPASLTMVSWTGYLYTPEKHDISTTITSEIYGDQVVWQIGDLPGLSYAYIYPHVLISSTVSPGDTLLNYAEISTTDTDSTPFDNDDNVEFLVAERLGDLLMTKWNNRVITATGSSLRQPEVTPSLLETSGFSVTEVPVGSDLEYGIAVYNSEKSELRNVVVTDTLPSGTSFVSWTGSGYSVPVTPIDNGDTVVWNIGTIAGDSYVYIYPRVHVSDTVSPGTVLWNNVACATSDTEDSLLNNTASVSVTTYLLQRCYTLTTDVNPAGSGTVGVNPSPNCEGTKYLKDTAVELTANAAAGYKFNGWSGDASGNANPITVTMDSDKAVTALINIRLVYLPLLVRQ